MKSFLIYLLGSPKQFDLRHRISNAVILIGILLGFQSSFFNYFLNLPTVTVYATLATSVILIFSYIISRFKKRFFLPVYLNLIFSIGLYTPVMWIGNGGSSGSFQYYIFVYITFVIAVIRNKKVLFSVIGLILILTIFLLYYEYKFPDRIFRYENPKDRFIDLIIGFTSVLIGVSALFYVYTNEYTKTNLELLDKNKQLADHNEELEQHKNEIEKQRRVLEAQKYHINESLNYAKKIQTAVLSSYVTLKKNVADSFLFHLPKEKISGDFYFFANKGNRLIVVIADSTGHGVPGGFMSMLGITMLEEIVNKENFNDAGTALNLFREKIISSLDRESAKNISGDGFDVAFCLIDTESMKMNFAGANIPLLIVRDKTIVTFEPDDMPVGKFLEMRTFKNHFADIQENDIIYLFTDGITDQFGGDKLTKFSMEKLKQILIDYSSDPLAVQKEKFKKIFRDWKGGHKRTDDALILGIKVK